MPVKDSMLVPNRPFSQRQSILRRGCTQNVEVSEMKALKQFLIPFLAILLSLVTWTSVAASPRQVVFRNDRSDSSLVAIEIKDTTVRLYLPETYRFNRDSQTDQVLDDFYQLTQNPQRVSLADPTKKQEASQERLDYVEHSDHDQDITPRYFEFKNVEIVEEPSSIKVLYDKTTVTRLVAQILTGKALDLQGNQFSIQEVKP